jgi:protein phosphatase
MFPESSGDDLFDTELLFVVADGMGGHRCGKEASEIAVRIAGAQFYTISGTVRDRLLKAVELANKAVRAYGDEHHECGGMGSTLTALALHQGKGVIAHVGDSRAYKISNGTIIQLTEDHSVVAGWQRKGWVTPEQAKVHPERSLLYRALGVVPEVDVDLVEGISLVDGDCLLLCTDGLPNHVDDEEIRSMVIGHSPADACERLVSLVLERGGYDNVTIQAVKIRGGG